MIGVLERASILLKELVVNYEDTIKDSAADEYAGDIGRYPYLQIGNLVIQTTETSKIVLYNDQFLPKIEVFFKDPTLKLIDPLFPIDDEIISLFIKSSSEMLMPVRMDFKITEFNVVKGSSDMNYVLVGLLNVDYLYFQEYSSYSNSSYGLLREIAKKANLGFASNIDDTNDKMSWINPANTNLEFIQDIVNCSYKSDNSFMLSYVDFYYNLNYVDIETALNEDITDMTGIKYDANFTKVKEEDSVKLVLTDHPDKINSNLYIDKYNLINNTTKINLDIGYNKYITYYDKNENIEYEYVIESISSPSNDVVTKGRIGELSEVYKHSMDSSFLGNLDSDNVHSNYLYAKVQNEQNLDFLQKIRMKVSLGSANFNLYRFQKIEVRLYKLKELDSEEVLVNVDKDTIQKGATADWDERKLNQRLSGEWLITAINYTFNKIGGFVQDVTLVRRELGFNENDYKS